MIAKIFTLPIRFYRYFISPMFPPSCRFTPTCSEYAIDCLKIHGLTKGFSKATKRVLSCHPIKILGGGEGYDPVIKESKVKK